ISASPSSLWTTPSQTLRSSASEWIKARRGAPGFGAGLCVNESISPGVVAIEPRRIVVAALHPRVCTRDGLDARGPWLAMRFVLAQCASHVAFGVRETARENRGILHRGRRALGHVGRHRMTRVAEQHNPPFAPLRQRLTLE